ncbi:hypothetical protein TruAng_011772 [Truncatella angustata]|nr:hypothetical protein TruAng_011772 [Truncatella angustata]
MRSSPILASTIAAVISLASAALGLETSYEEPNLRTTNFTIWYRHYISPYVGYTLPKYFDVHLLPTSQPSDCYHFYFTGMFLDERSDVSRDKEGVRIVGSDWTQPDILEFNVQGAKYRGERVDRSDKYFGHHTIYKDRNNDIYDRDNRKKGNCVYAIRDVPTVHCPSTYYNDEFYPETRLQAIFNCTKYSRHDEP